MKRRLCSWLVERQDRLSTDALDFFRDPCYRSLDPRALTILSSVQLSSDPTGIRWTVSKRSQPCASSATGTSGPARHACTKLIELLLAPYSRLT